MSAPSTIIVDERDARISYAGTWTPSSNSADYKRTHFSSNDTNASMTFSFNGSSIALVGGYEPGGSCSGTFSVDGSTSSWSSSAVTETTSQQTIFSKNGLSDGSHTFVYKPGACQPASNTNSSSAGGQFVYVDYLLYTATNPTLDGITYFVDDRDPGLQYSGSWTQQSNQGAFQQTTSGGSSGSSVKYTFTGTGVSVRATLIASTGVISANFALDGEAQNSFSSGPQNSSNVEVYQSKKLDQGQHTLEITSTGQANFWLDYLTVEPGSSASFTTTTEKHSEPNLAAIVGGSVGGVVALGGAFLVFWLILRKRGLATKKKSRYSGASSAKTFWRKENGGTGTISGLSYAASTGAASSWSRKVESVATGVGSRRNSRASKPPSLPSTRPALYSPIEDNSPGLNDDASRAQRQTPRHPDDDETAPLSPLEAAVPQNVYPPTPPYNNMSFDQSSSSHYSHSRPQTPAARSAMYSPPSSPSHTVTSFDPSVIQDPHGTPANLLRSPSYRTTAPESHSISSRATSYVSASTHQQHQHQPLPSVDRRASLTPSYITTVPVGATLEISDFLPPRVAAARQEVLAAAASSSNPSAPSTPPSSFNRGRSQHAHRQHDRSPSYSTTASSGISSPGYNSSFATSSSSSPYTPPRVPPVPHPILTASPSSSSKHANVPVTPPQRSGPLPHTPTSLISRGVSPARTAASSARPTGPRAGQPLPRPPSPSSRPVTPSTVPRPGTAPSTITVGSEAPSTMTTAELKEREALSESLQNQPPDSSGSSPGEAPPQYTYRF